MVSSNSDQPLIKVVGNTNASDLVLNPLPPPLPRPLPRSLPEEEVRAVEHRVGQRLPQYPVGVCEPGPGLAGSVPVQPGEEAPGGAGSGGEGGLAEGLPPGALPLAEHHRDAGLPTQPQDQHCHQLVPQLQASLPFPLRGEGSLLIRKHEN